MNPQTQYKRPPRLSKGDRLLDADATIDETAVGNGYAPVDALATKMEMKWGIDKLPGYASVDTAMKYGRAIATLNAAIAEGDVHKVKLHAKNCIKGLHLMDAEATAAGHQPATGDFWEYDLDGFKIGVLKDGAEWMPAKDARPDLRFFTMREVAIALKAYSDNFAIAEVKDAFPGATVTKITAKLPKPDYRNGGDVIPF